MSAIDWVLFQQTFGYGTTRAGRLLQRFDPAALFSLAAAELRDAGSFTKEELERI